jgi:ATP-dependent DNA helicase RecG
VIAEADLKLRGGGDILGTRQTGLPDFHFLDLEKDSDVVSAARKEAMLVLEKDEHLTSGKGRLLRQLLRCFGLDEAVRYLGSG